MKLSKSGCVFWVAVILIPLAFLLILCPLSSTIVSAIADNAQAKRLAAEAEADEASAALTQAKAVASVIEAAGDAVDWDRKQAHPAIWWGDWFQTVLLVLIALVSMLVLAGIMLLVLRPEQFEQVLDWFKGHFDKRQGKPGETGRYDDPAGPTGDLDLE